MDRIGYEFILVHTYHRQSKPVPYKTMNKLSIHTEITRFEVENNCFSTSITKRRVNLNIIIFKVPAIIYYFAVHY